MDNYYYPAGADNENAPWNKSSSLNPVEVECCVSYSLSKTMPIYVSHYTLTEDYDTDIDEEGHTITIPTIDKDFEDTNFLEEFDNNGAIGIPTLLSELQKLSEEHIERLKEELSYLTPLTNTMTEEKIKKEIKHYEAVLEAAKGWIVDELDIEKE